jgi:transcription factor E2F3
MLPCAWIFAAPAVVLINTARPLMARNLNSDRLSSTRAENSLHNLTRKFLRLISLSPERSININQASEQLNVGKRRIYDITNVLEGLGLLSKWSVNSAKWIGGCIEQHLCSDNEEKENEEEPCSDDARTTREEAELDETLERLNEEISMLSQSEKNLANAYVTYADIQNLPSLSEKLVFAVKAPSETTMEYPRYEKGSYKLKLTSEQGAISVYYVSDDKS